MYVYLKNLKFIYKAKAKKSPKNAECAIMNWLAPPLITMEWFDEVGDGLDETVVETGALVVNGDFSSVVYAGWVETEDAVLGNLESVFSAVLV